MQVLMAQTLMSMSKLQKQCIVIMNEIQFFQREFTFWKTFLIILPTMSWGKQIVTCVIYEFAFIISWGINWEGNSTKTSLKLLQLLSNSSNILHHLNSWNIKFLDFLHLLYQENVHMLGNAGSLPAQNLSMLE